MTADTPVSPVGLEYAGQLFFRLWRATHTHTAAALEQVGLTPALFALLSYLEAHEGAIQQEIGSAMGIDPSTMVSLVDQLESDGLARRRPRAEDRRAREVLTTGKGQGRLKKARELAVQVESEILQGLSPSERQRLLSLLRKALATAPPQPLWSSREGD